MRTRTRDNLVLLVLAALLGTAVLLLPDPGPERPPPAIDFDAQTLESVTVERLDRTATIRIERRADGDWAMVTPEQRALNGGRVSRALAALRARTTSCYSAAEREKDEFGLDPPQATIMLDAISVEFGYRAPDGRRYVRAQGRLCLVEDLTLPILSAPVTDRNGDG